MQFYPPAPASVAPEKLQPSLNFRKQVSKVITSISVFFVAYIIMVILSVLLAALCVYGGIMLIVAIPKLLTILLGVGLMALGVSVVYFLIKFIFAVSKDEKESRIRITESEQPELFAFIRKISEETQTPFPKKIFLSPDVNACVFYNSSFWSMFFPVRKNLEIGLGLVNCINISELKAVIAHEFGHFSQRSMKLGSFTYNVNKVIHNMLYENQGYAKFLNSWGSISGEVAIFANITVKIAQFIQWILRGFYKMVNKDYMSLSREMEFHADAIAASVSGGNNLVSALSRIEIAASCYDSAINKANEFLKQKKYSSNVFHNQSTIYLHFAKEYELPVKNNLPEISSAFVESFSKSRINFQNQWASHPVLAERRAHLENLAINCEPLEHSAWIVFRDADKLQETFTSNLYQHIQNDGEKIEYYDRQKFDELFYAEIEQVTLPQEYKGFYNKRYVDMSQWDLDQLITTSSDIHFHQLFNAENSQLQTSIDALQRDIEIVKAIKEKQIDTGTFDFDGNKYTREQSEEVINTLEKELAELKDKQQHLDKQAFALFYKQTPGIRHHYEKYQELSRKHDEYYKIVKDIYTTLGPLYQNNLTVQEVEQAISTIKNDQEPEFKKFLKDYLDTRKTEEQINHDLRQQTLKFIDNNYAYFQNNEFFNSELEEMQSLIQNIGTKLDDEKFLHYKQMLLEQLKVS